MSDKILEAYQTFVNEIDDYFEYAFSSPKDKEHVEKAFNKLAGVIALANKDSRLETLVRKYYEAEVATRQCSDMILSTGQTEEPKRLMAELDKTRSAMYEAIGMDPKKARLFQGQYSD